MTGQTLTLWDSGPGIADDEGLVFSWDGYEETESVRSLPRYVEEHAERLRRKYIGWIHELGETQLGEKRLIDHLAFEDGLSYWWMTLFVEQSPGKSPSIIDAIRLLALEEIAVKLGPDKLRLVSSNQDLDEVLRGMCQGLGIAYEWERPSGRVRRPSLRAIARALPQVVQALIALGRHLFVYWPFSRAGRAGWHLDPQALFFASYFFNLDPDQAEKGSFHSRHWEDLHDLMERLGVPGNWLQIWMRHQAVPNPETALNWASLFNREHPERGFHAFLHAYLSWALVLRVLRRWIKLARTSRGLKGIRDAFRPPGSRLSLWPLMREDWAASMRGRHAINNLLWVELFDSALRDIPFQAKGLYLCENMAWERALVHAWRKHGHGRLIGVAHSTVRFWDLRYFTDSRTIRSSAPHSIPKPDVIALNGKPALDAYLNMDYPREDIEECEALRYGYVNDLREGGGSRRHKGDPLRVLILGGIAEAGTRGMLHMLEVAAPDISSPVRYTLKPHPGFVVDAKDFPSLGLSVVSDPLGEILLDFDLVFASNMTSASVDAYLAGLPVVVTLDRGALNFSPLRGEPGVRFVCTAAELVEAFEAEAGMPKHGVERSEYFCLDPEFPRWRRLLFDEGQTPERPTGGGG